MTDKELKKLRDVAGDPQKKTELLAERIKQLDSVKHLIPSPKGWFKNKCPKCGNKLSKRTLGKMLTLFSEQTYTYWLCTCGYEYGIIDIIR